MFAAQYFRRYVVYQCHGWPIRIATMAALLLPCFPARAALPTDFSDRVEAALLCRSEWSTSFWAAYFTHALAAPIRDWGGARWWSANGAILGGVPASEIFMNISDDRVLMIGALIDQPVKSARDMVEKHFGVRFQPVQTSDGVRYVNDTLSVMLATTDGRTKWYCARWNLGNRP